MFEGAMVIIAIVSYFLYRNRPMDVINVPYSEYVKNKGKYEGTGKIIHIDFDK